MSFPLQRINSSNLPYFNGPLQQAAPRSIPRQAGTPLHPSARSHHTASPLHCPSSHRRAPPALPRDSAQVRPLRVRRHRLHGHPRRQVHRRTPQLAQGLHMVRRRPIIAEARRGHRGPRRRHRQPRHLARRPPSRQAPRRRDESRRPQRTRQRRQGRLDHRGPVHALRQAARGRVRRRWDSLRGFEWRILLPGGGECMPGEQQ